MINIYQRETEGVRINMIKTILSMIGDLEYNVSLIHDILLELLRYGVIARIIYLILCYIEVVSWALL